MITVPFPLIVQWASIDGAYEYNIMQKSLGPPTTLKRFWSQEIQFYLEQFSSYSASTDTALDNSGSKVRKRAMLVLFQSR